MKTLRTVLLIAVAHGVLTERSNRPDRFCEFGRGMFMQEILRGLAFVF